MAFVRVALSETGIGGPGAAGFIYNDANDRISQVYIDNDSALVCNLVLFNEETQTDEVNLIGNPGDHITQNITNVINRELRRGVLFLPARFKIQVTWG